ncbi:MAG: DOMON domain-containing protein [Candidatus Heimdallarchaeota archaeon]
MRLRIISVILLLLFISVVLVSMGMVRSTINSAFALEPTNSGVISPNQNSNITVDGTISEDEYKFHWEFSGGHYTLFWEIVDDSIFIGIEGKTVGWVALGIDPEVRMKGADMIFAWVDDQDNVILKDAFSTGVTGPHPEDNDTVGGEPNISNFAGSQESTTTIIEFERDLTTNDTKGDKAIPPEENVDILWAVGSSDDWDAIHNYRGKARVNFKDGSVLEFSGFLEPAEVFGLSILAGFLFLFVSSVVVVSVFVSKKSAVTPASAPPRLNTLLGGKTVERRLLNRINIALFFVFFLVWLFLMWWTIENGRILISLIRGLLMR